jgi:hypothetical protein
LRLELPFSEEDRQRLASVLGNADDVDRVARMVALAGAMEAIDQATGKAVFSSMTDLRSYRIYCLVRQGMALAEAESLVAHLFKVTASSARRMVGQAMARYAVELNAAMNREASAMLDSARWNTESERWEVGMPTAFIRNRLLEILSRSDLPNPKSADRGAVWQFPDETYQWVREQLGLSARQAQ